MLSILKTKKPYEQEAKALYAQCLSAVRLPWFYQTCALPDTMETRFDLLVLHLFLIIERNLSDPSIDGEDVNQALFDRVFIDMDQTLREMGIGDMGIPKRMRKMMTGFNGRMHSYRDAVAAYDSNAETAALRAVIARNIYADDSAETQALADYTLQQRARLAPFDFSAMLAQTPLFEDPQS